MTQMDLTGSPVQAVTQGESLPSPGRLAVMAATGADLRMLLVILIAMELPLSGLLSVAGC